MEGKGYRATAEAVRKNRAEMQALKEKGWESIADTPYSVQRELNSFSIKTSSLTILTKPIFREILEGKDAEYVSTNVKKISVSTFVSPELRAEIKKKIEEHYEERRLNKRT